MVLCEQGTAGFRRARDPLTPRNATGRRCCPPTASIMRSTSVSIFARPERVRRIVLTASGGPFRDWSLDRMAPVTRRAGGRASQLVDGREDLGRFRHDDEQGPGTDRGGAAVPGAARPDRDRRPPPVGDPQLGRLHRRIDAGAARPVGHARTDRALTLAWPRPDGDTQWHRSISWRSVAWISTRSIRSAFPAIRLAREALDANGARPAILNAANEIAVAAFLAGRIGFLEIAAIVEDTLEPLRSARSGNAGGGDRGRCAGPARSPARA